MQDFISACFARESQTVNNLFFFFFLKTNTEDINGRCCQKPLYRHRLISHSFNLQGNKTPSLPIRNAKHFVWLQRHFSSWILSYVFPWEPKCLHHSLFLPRWRPGYPFVTSGVDCCSSVSGSSQFKPGVCLFHISGPCLSPTFPFPPPRSHSNQENK